MPRMISRSLDSLASAPLRFRSVLRLVLIVLIALLVSITHVEHRNDAVFKAVLVLYAVGSVVWLFFVMFRVPPAFGSWASTAADVVIVVILCIASGPGTIALYPIFFLLPISVAFLDSPLATAALGFGASFGYLLAWVFYAIGDHKLVDGIPAVVYVQVGCLLWLCRGHHLTLVRLGTPPCPGGVAARCSSPLDRRIDAGRRTGTIGNSPSSCTMVRCRTCWQRDST